MKANNPYTLRIERLSFVTIALLCFTVFIWTWKRALILGTSPLQGRFQLPQDGVIVAVGSVEDEAAVGASKDIISNEETNSDEEAREKRADDGNEETTGLDTSTEVKECNYANGKWVVDQNQTLYSGFGCKRWLSSPWSCRLSRRPDFAYENLRWEPKDCELERFESSKFLKRLENKTLAIVGDSLGRQQFQSLVCMITGGDDQRDDVVDVREEYGGAYNALRFTGTNTTVLYAWSATLCEIQPLNATDQDTDYAMHLDRPASFLAENIHRIDVLVLNTKHHWNRGKFLKNRWKMHVGGVRNTDKHLQQIWQARNAAVRSVVKWVDSQMGKYPGLKVLYRTESPKHFVGGEWNTGGSCDNMTPMSIGTEVVEERPRDSAAASAVEGTRVRLLDVTGLSRVRDEAHISRFRNMGNSKSSDCLHWCLPGVPDTWNEILYALL